MVNLMKMRMQKKVLAGILVGAMMLSTSACGSADIKADAVTVMEPQQEETEELGDLSELVKTTFNPDKALESDKDETVYCNNSYISYVMLNSGDNSI